MEILIRDSETKLYLNSEAAWVSNEADARVFPVPLDGLKFCVEHQLKKVELAFRYAVSPLQVHFTGISMPEFLGFYGEKTAR